MKKILQVFPLREKDSRQMGVVARETGRTGFAFCVQELSLATNTYTERFSVSFPHKHFVSTSRFFKHSLVFLYLCKTGALHATLVNCANQTRSETKEISFLDRFTSLSYKPSLGLVVLGTERGEVVLYKLWVADKPFSLTPLKLLVVSNNPIKFAKLFRKQKPSKEKCVSLTSYCLAVFDLLGHYTVFDLFSEIPVFSLLHLGIVEDFSLLIARKLGFYLQKNLQRAHSFSKNYLFYETDHSLRKTVVATATYKIVNSLPYPVDVTSCWDFVAAKDFNNYTLILGLNCGIIEILRFSFTVQTNKTVKNMKTTRKLYSIEKNGYVQQTYYGENIMQNYWDTFSEEKVFVTGKCHTKGLKTEIVVFYFTSRNKVGKFELK